MCIFAVRELKEEFDPFLSPSLSLWHGWLLNVYSSGVARCDCPSGSVGFSFAAGFHPVGFRLCRYGSAAFT